MHQNLYDDPTFFAAYQRMRGDARGLHEWLIVPSLTAILPVMTEKRVIELGCGDGWFCRLAAESGAASVVGVDPSERMLSLSRARTTDERITFVQSFAEDAAFPDASADLVVSILAFHYVADLAVLLRRLARWLVPGGALVEFVEHPIYTSRVETDAWSTEGGRHAAWRIGDYFDEGARSTTWFVDGVVRYHRTLSTILALHLDAGLTIDLVVEPRPGEDALEANPEARDELVRPAILALRASRTDRASGVPDCDRATARSRSSCIRRRACIRPSIPARTRRRPGPGSVSSPSRTRP